MAFEEYLAKIEEPERYERMVELLDWVAKQFPNLTPRIAWNQPMYTDHGTFIIGFSMSKKHLAVSPEVFAINHFSDAIKQAGYEHTKNLMRIPWDGPVDFSLLEKMIAFNMMDKAEETAFWRKPQK